MVGGIFGLLLLSAMAWAGPDWDRIIREGGSEITWGIQLLGPAPLSKNAEKELPPASNAKLFTAAAALALLGPNYRFETKIQWKADPSRPHRVSQLILRGSGDPMWGLSEVKALARAVVEAGIKEVVGPVQVLAFDPRWDQLRIPRGWEPQDQQACYGALAQAINFNLNCARFIITSSTQGHWVDPAISVPVSVQLRRGRYTDLQIHPIHKEGRPSAGYKIRGTLRRGIRSVGLDLIIHDSARRVQELWRRALLAQGIRFLEPNSDLLETAAVTELPFYSPPLSVILKPFLKYSLNTLGDALLKAMGARSENHTGDLLDLGVDALARFVRERLRRTQGVVLWDGSGLSREDRVTADALLDLLNDMLKQPEFPVFWDALSIAGVDGTLANRMRGTAAEGLLRGKTGTLDGVYNLSGYVPRLGTGGSITEYVPFVMLSQTDEDHASMARAIEDRLGATLAKLLHYSGASEDGILLSVNSSRIFGSTWR